MCVCVRVGVYVRICVCVEPGQSSLISSLLWPYYRLVYLTSSISQTQTACLYLRAPHQTEAGGHLVLLQSPPSRCLIITSCDFRPTSASGQPIVSLSSTDACAELIFILRNNTPLEKVSWPIVACCQNGRVSDWRGSAWTWGFTFLHANKCLLMCSSAGDLNRNEAFFWDFL